jgi:hypothetical protein
MELKQVALLALTACIPQSKRLVMPEGMLRVNEGPAVAASRPQRDGFNSETHAAADPYAVPGGGAPSAPAVKATPAVAKGPAAVPPLRAPTASPTPPDQRYVLRLVEHGRVWEVELPESTGGYEVRVPLGPPIEAPTAADQELMGKDPKGAPPKSYLSTLAKIAEMYASHRYELALIEAVDLGQQYPKEARVEAMKGSLFQKLGKTELARNAWKKALELDPTDVTVAEALRGLKGE